MVLVVGTAGAAGDAAGAGVLVEVCEEGPVANGLEGFEHATATTASAIAETKAMRVWDPDLKLYTVYAAARACARHRPRVEADADAAEH